MPLLKDAHFVTDAWVRVADDAALPEEGDVIVGFARLLKDWQALEKRKGGVGVEVPNVERAQTLELFLPKLKLIVLPFPAFTDGRAYSLARQIRELGFRGELRAAGNVLPDQLQFMISVGFDSFEVTERFPEPVWQRTASSMSVSYQARGGARNVWSERHAEARPWFEQPHAG
ncbi:MAG: DUF934 domain-containing protein [Parvibaculaceae bacterium]